MQTETPVLFYLHIPKAGGTTLNKWLHQVLADSSRCPSDGRWYQSGIFYYPCGFVQPADPDVAELTARALARRDLRAVVGHFDFGLHRQLDRPRRVVTMLRHPVARIRSLHRFQVLNERKYGHFEGIPGDGTDDLETFVRQPPYAEADNGMTRRLSGAGRSTPIGRCDRSMLIRAKANLRDGVDVVGLTEAFDETLLMIANLLGRPDPPLYYPRNISSEAAEAEVPEREQRLIRHHNALDMELYRYARARFRRARSRSGSEFERRVERYRDRRSAWLREIGDEHVPRWMR